MKIYVIFLASEYIIQSICDGFMIEQYNPAKFASTGLRGISKLLIRKNAKKKLTE
jgi:hypothetical protein